LCSLLTVHSAGQVALIYAVLLVRGIGYVLLDAGESALLPAALPREMLGDVNGWRSSAQEGMKLVAPLAGAALYAWRGPVPVVLLCAALPLVTALLYTLVRVPARSSPARPSAGPVPASRSVPSAASSGSVPGADPAERASSPSVSPAGRASPPVGSDSPAAARAGLGWASVRAGLLSLRRGPMWTPVVVAAVAISASGVTNAAVLSRLVDGLRLPATHLGVLSGVQGAGSIVGGLLVGRLLSRLGVFRVAILGAVLFAIACVTWSLPWWPTMLTGSALAGLGLPWTLVAALTAIQAGTPDHLLGRVAATANMVMFGPIALAIPLGSALVLLGSRLPLLLGAGAAMAVALFAATRSPRSLNAPAR
jgi:hypothetical protein